MRNRHRNIRNMIAPPIDTYVATIATTAPSLETVTVVGAATSIHARPPADPSSSPTDVGPAQSSRVTSTNGRLPVAWWPMTVDRGVAASWAIGMGLLLGAVAGTVVSTRTPGEEVRRVAGFALLFVPALYAMIVSRWDHWHPKNPTSDSPCCSSAASPPSGW